jgi:hypothetical protein
VSTETNEIRIDCLNNGDAFMRWVGDIRFSFIIPLSLKLLVTLGSAMTVPLLSRWETLGDPRGNPCFINVIVFFN